MSAAHQQFSARTRQSGELDKPGKRRRALKDGRISVTVGADLGCVLEYDGKERGLAAGALIRNVVLEHYAANGEDRTALAARAAAIREARETSDSITEAAQAQD